MSDSYSRRSRPPSLVWPIILIGIGVYFLLMNLGLLPQEAWLVLVNLWPLLLILIGIDLLFGRRSLLGALFSGLLAAAIIGGIIWLVYVGPDKVPGFSWIKTTPQVQTQKIKVPLEDISEAQVNIDWSTGTQTLYSLGEASRNLLEGEIRYHGKLLFDVQTSANRSTIRLSESHQSPNFFLYPPGNADWYIGLHPNVIYDLNLEGGSGTHKFDLMDLQLSHFYLDAHSGNISLTLPEGNYTAEIEGGSGNINLLLPANIAARIVYSDGSGNLDLPAGLITVSGGQDEEKSVWETPNYDENEDHLILIIDQSSGNITIDWFNRTVTK